MTRRDISWKWKLVLVIPSFLPLILSGCIKQFIRQNFVNCWNLKLFINGVNEQMQSGKLMDWLKTTGPRESTAATPLNLSVCQSVSLSMSGSKEKCSFRFIYQMTLYLMRPSQSLLWRAIGVSTVNRPFFQSACWRHTQRYSLSWIRTTHNTVHMPPDC